jgi:hypothetical protein
MEIVMNEDGARMFRDEGSYGLWKNMQGTDLPQILTRVSNAMIVTPAILGLLIPLGV